MSDHGRAGLLLLAMLCSLGVVPVLLRGLRPAVILAVHGVGMCVAFAAAISALTGAVTGPSLALAYAVMIGLVGLEHRPDGTSRQWLRISAIGLSITGLLLALAAQLWPSLGSVASLTAASLGTLWAAPASVALVRRARRRSVPAWASADRAAAAATLLAAAGLSLGAVERWLPGLWPVTLGAAGALVSSVRVAPWVPPTAREWSSVALVGLATLLSITVVAGPTTGVIAAGHVAAVALGVIALSRGLHSASRSVMRPALPPGVFRDPQKTSPLSSEAIGVLAPMVDDGAVRRPARPAIATRVSARRILDAALDRARSRQVGVEHLEIEIDTREGDADLDIECDVGAVAEALCAVVDNALRLRSTHPQVGITVYVRGGHRQVTFEVSDDLGRFLGPDEELVPPDAERPFFSADRGAGGRTGLGLGLARAKVLLQRQGGLLMTRQTEDGSCVQVTVPRRRERSSLALA